jgi:hypothetical protein
LCLGSNDAQEESPRRALSCGKCKNYHYKPTVTELIINPEHKES